MKNKVKVVVCIFIGIIFGLAIPVTAQLVTSAENISLDSSKTTKTNVKDSLDELYDKVNKCPDGKICINYEEGTIDSLTSNKKCRRAMSLHKDSSYIYGNNAITNGVLNTGDAFTCDVNGDGVYDETNERFYYVSDYYDQDTKTFNSSVAVFMYYTDTGGKVPYNSSGVNYQGPTYAVSYLPSTTQWSNITLYKTSRKIIGENESSYTDGDALVFSYAGRAARLITKQEMDVGCPGNLNSQKCRFFIANVSSSLYGYWIENPVTSNNYQVYFVFTGRNAIDINRANQWVYGVRPAIELLKTDVAY